MGMAERMGQVKLLDAGKWMVTGTLSGTLTVSVLEPVWTVGLWETTTGNRLVPVWWEQELVRASELLLDSLMVMLTEPEWRSCPPCFDCPCCFAVFCRWRFSFP